MAGQWERCRSCGRVWFRTGGKKWFCPTCRAANAKPCDKPGAMKSVQRATQRAPEKLRGCRVAFRHGDRTVSGVVITRIRDTRWCVESPGYGRMTLDRSEFKLI